SRDVARASYTKRGSDTIGDHAVHVIEARPKKGADSEYGKVLVYIRKSDKVPLKFKFYDDSDELLKTLFVEKLEENDDGETYIKQMQMRSEKGGYTRIVVESIDSGVETPDATFTKDQLGK
ncbi:MAG: outer membrane lipoprotein-sorting protein, partial [Bradymonadaceae bacterium]